jgi:hypothetical protein
MNGAELERDSFLSQRRVGIAVIAAAMPAALLLWLAIAFLAPPVAGIGSLGARMMFALKCC